MGRDQDVQYVLHLSARSILARVEKHSNYRGNRHRRDPQRRRVLRRSFCQYGDIGSTAINLCILELLLRLFDSWNGTVPRSSGYSLPTIQSIESHVGNRALLPVHMNDDPICSVCGTYEQLQYWPNAFDDFYVSETERPLFWLSCFLYAVIHGYLVQYHDCQPMVCLRQGVS